MDTSYPELLHGKSEISVDIGDYFVGITIKHADRIMVPIAEAANVPTELVLWHGRYADAVITAQVPI